MAALLGRMAGLATAQAAGTAKGPAPLSSPLGVTAGSPARAAEQFPQATAPADPAARQAFETNRLLEDARQKDAQKKLDERNIREQGSIAAQRAQTSRPTKGGTLLTSPLGITGGGMTPRKTLLGL